MQRSTPATSDAAAAAAGPIGAEPARRRRWLRSDRRGAAAMLAALAMPTMMSGAGLAVDAGLWYRESARLHLAANAAALAAAHFLADSNASQADIQAVAQAAVTDLTGNRLVGSQVTPQVTLASDRTWLSITLSSHADSYFSRLVLPNGVPISASAKAGLLSPWAGKPCVLALGNGTSTTPSIDVENEASITGTGCSVVSNSTATFNCSSQGPTTPGGAIYVRNGSIVAASVGAPGTVCANTWNGATTISPNPVSGEGEVADPEGELEAPEADDSNCQPGTYGWQNGGILNLSPGTYCSGLQIGNGMTVNFAPGTYYIKGGDFDITGGAKVGTANGVTFFLDGANFSFENDAQAPWAMSAPTSGPLAGILIWQKSGSCGSNPQDTVTGSAGAAINGTIYVPDATLQIINAAKLSYPTDSNGNPTGSFSVIANMIGMANGGAGQLVAGGLAPGGTGSGGVVATVVLLQ